jgi:hypothetical protein
MHWLFPPATNSIFLFDFGTTEPSGVFKNQKYLRIELVGFLVYMYQQSWFLLPKQWPAHSKKLLQHKYDSPHNCVVPGK